MRIAPNVIGRIQPLIAPAIISKLTGLPINKKTKVEITINVITIRLFLLSNDLCSVFKNVALVYAEPITEDIAAANITTPKIFLPIGPNACWKTDAGGFSELSVTPVTTTPSTAKNYKVRMTPVVKIPATADRFTKGRYDLPFIPESRILCAPAKVI